MSGLESWRASRNDLRLLFGNWARSQNSQTAKKEAEIIFKNGSVPYEKSPPGERSIGNDRCLLFASLGSWPFIKQLKEAEIIVKKRQRLRRRSLFRLDLGDAFPEQSAARDPSTLEVP
jgi:hypothetical protein